MGGTDKFGMVGMVGVEILEHGRGKAPRRRARIVLTAVGMVVATLVGIGLFVDQRTRSREDEALDACSTALQDVAGVIDAKIRSRVEYFRVGLSSGPTQSLQRSYDEQIGLSARGQEQRFDEVRRLCAEVAITRFHTAQQERKDACMDDLDRYVAYVQAVLEDGSNAYTSTLRVSAC